MEGASSRYRVFQYLPYLTKMGISCSVQSFMDAEMYMLSLKSGYTIKKIIMTLKATIIRVSRLLKWRKYDILYLQRELLPFGPPIIERMLKSQGAVIIFDYDDALFIKKPSRYNPLATLLRSPDKTIAMFKLSNYTVAGNNWLRDVANAHGGKARTIEVAEDTGRFKIKEKYRNNKPITIGWLGSHSTVKYLRLIESQLISIARKHPEIQWEIIGGGEFEMREVPWKLYEWSIDEEVEGLARFDIGLMPLPLQEWSRGKSGGKARTYMAAGVVPVVSAIGYNLELIKNEVTGYLCYNNNDWECIIEDLIADTDKRKRVAAAARLDVETRFNPARQANEMVNLFNEIISEVKA